MNDWNRISDEIAALNANLMHMASRPPQPPVQPQPQPQPQHTMNVADLMQLMQGNAATGAATNPMAELMQQWQAAQSPSPAPAPTPAAESPRQQPEPDPSHARALERIRTLEAKVDGLSRTVETLVQEIGFLTHALMKATAARDEVQTETASTPQPTNGPDTADREAASEYPWPLDGGPPPKTDASTEENPRSGTLSLVASPVDEEAESRAADASPETSEAQSAEHDERPQPSA